MIRAINPPNIPLIDSRGYIMPDWYRYLVGYKKISDGMTGADVLTTGDASLIYPNSRALGVVDGELTASDAPPDFTLGLADTGPGATSVGDASHVIQIAIDAKGRVVAVDQFELDSDNVAEGATNLFFTQARARESLSGGVGIAYDQGTGAIALDAVPAPDGTYSNPTSLTIQNGIITAIS